MGALHPPKISKVQQVRAQNRVSKVQQKKNFDFAPSNFFFWLRRCSLLTPPHSFYTTFSNYFIVFFLAWSTVASVQFVMHNYDDLFLSLQTCAMIIGGIQSVAMYIGIGINSDDVTALHERLQSIVDEAVDESKIYENYWRREQYCRTFTERVSRYTHLEQAIYVSAFAKSIFYLVTGNFDAEKLVLPYNLKMPFNTQTILGWYLFWFVCASMSFAFASILVPVTGYFVSCYHYIAAISEHIDILAASIDRDIDEAIAERNPYKTAYIYNKVHTTFRNLLEFIRVFMMFSIGLHQCTAVEYSGFYHQWHFLLQ
ncbi:uncharacterized protein LOC129569589 [Sitodiplosis mosellana]|uniref:uncharacterized protein LOC129569589 n=1 Tax=Sitodiplosis mosellana TaxID=263140 RepID=UPI002443CC33|nr:uncharacterized protein LOC129569589 [Sitodiplosis mosellana]XP_055304583.1 uncharacterized protein LOC129569589 [Sitodiplosis mosellana]